jgi:prepilin-type N-terminal cleavage/methylation domain-containing protein
MMVRVWHARILALQNPSTIADGDVPSRREAGEERKAFTLVEMMVVVAIIA